MITTNDINNSNPVLILYSSGTGGEFITSLLAEVSDEFNPLGETEVNKQRNRTHVNCVLDYAALWKDPANPKTWIPPHVDNTMIGSKRYLLKDHPQFLYKYYKKYLPNVTILHFTMYDNFEYYAKVTFAKLQNKVQVADLNFDFVFNNITTSTDHDLFNYVYEWASKYDWVWEHELQAVAQSYISNTKRSEYIHVDSIQTYIDQQVLAIQKECKIISDQLALAFKNYTTIDITDIYSSRKMWKQISKSINITDIEKAIRKTDAWQKRNRKLVA